MNIWLTVLGFIAVFNLLVLSTILIVKKPDCIKNRLLAYIVISPTFCILFNEARYFGVIVNYPVLLYLDYLINYAWSPILLFYIYIMIGRPIRFRLAILLHFLPFIVVVVLTTWFIIQPIEFKNLFLTEVQNKNSRFVYIIDNFLTTQMTIYLLASFFIIRRYNRKVQEYCSNLHKVSLLWLEEFMVVYISMGFLAFIPLWIWPGVETLLISVPATCIISYSYLMLKGVSSPAFLNTKEYNMLSESLLDTVNPNRESVEKYKNSTLSNEYLDKLCSQIETYFIEKQPYLDSDLDIKSVSENLQIPIHHVSETINRKLNKNFFDFVNSFRVEHARRLLANPKYNNYTIEAIGAECGFGTRVTFFSVFKKNTNQSPSTFRKLVKS